MVICCCDGTVDGILTAVFEAWKIDVNTTRISIGKPYNNELFAEYREVVTDINKASRVADSIIRRISRYAYELVFQTCVSSYEDRGNAVLHFIRKGFERGASVVDDMKDIYVSKVVKLSLNTRREYLHYQGFLRFVKIDNFLMAQYEPNNDILTMLADHFSDRLMQENFAIVDMKRAKAAIHLVRRDYIVTEVDINEIKELKQSEYEEDIKQLWKSFCETIAIKERTNKKLQQQMMPLRFRKYGVEFEQGINRN